MSLRLGWATIVSSSLSAAKAKTRANQGLLCRPSKNFTEDNQGFLVLKPREGETHTRARAHTHTHTPTHTYLMLGPYEKETTQ